MAYRLERNPSESAQHALRRIARDQFDKALAEIDDPGLSPAKKVHQARKRCKKLRALLRLYRPALGEATFDQQNTALRDTARLVSDLRDAKVMIDTYDAVCDRFAEAIDRRRFGSIRAGLTRHRDALAEDDHGVDERLGQVRQRLQHTRDEVGDWSLNEDGFDAVRAGLEKTYKRGRHAMADAADDPGPARFHEWRKRAKYTRYHLRILRPIWPTILNAQRDAYGELTDRLGDAHDLAELVRFLRTSDVGFGNDNDVAAFIALAERRRRALEAAALPLGQALYHDKPKRLVKRMHAWWDAWHDAARIHDAAAPTPSAAAAS